MAFWRLSEIVCFCLKNPSKIRWRLDGLRKLLGPFRRLTHLLDKKCQNLQFNMMQLMSLLKTSPTRLLLKSEFEIDIISILFCFLITIELLSRLILFAFVLECLLQFDWTSDGTLICDQKRREQSL